jgi:hypothetical protein
MMDAREQKDGEMVEKEKRSTTARRYAGCGLRAAGVGVGVLAAGNEGFKCLNGIVGWERNDDDTQDADSGRALVGLGGFAGKRKGANGQKQANPGKCDWAGRSLRALRKSPTARKVQWTQCALQYGVRYGRLVQRGRQTAGYRGLVFRRRDAVT